MWNVPDLCHCLRPQMSERLLDVENEAMLKIVELEKQLMQTNKELDHIRVRNHMNTLSCLGSNERPTNKSVKLWFGVQPSPATLVSPIKRVFCAGGVCQCKLSGSHPATNGSREGPDNSQTKSSRTPSSRAPADWRSCTSSTTKRRRRWGRG